MSIIIRLQKLPLEANSLDIRRFFQGLHIPDGGVHIVGGENGDAFIAFGSDEDARQAMGRDGQNIKNTNVSLLLSSRHEMQKVIESARNMSSMQTPSGGQPPGNSVVPAQPIAVPPPAGGQQQYLNNQYPSQQPPSQPIRTPNQIGQSAAPLIQNHFYPPSSQISPSNGNSSYGQQRTGLPPQSSNSFPQRARSRSRSPPSVRNRYEDFSNSSSVSQGQVRSTMHSGILGSLQQQPAPNYSQNGSYNNQSSNNSLSNYDQNLRDFPQQSQHGAPPPSSSMIYGRTPSDDRSWNSTQQVMNNASQSGVENYRSQNNPQEIYRKIESTPLLAQPNQSNQYGEMPNMMGSSFQYGQPSIMPSPLMQPPTSHHPASQNAPVGGGQALLPQSSSSSSSQLFTLQLFNLPLNVRPIDLIEFFRPIYLHEGNIKICFDEKGFPTGVGLVRFATPREFDSALNYNNKFLFDRQIQIRPLDEINGPPSTISGGGGFSGGILNSVSLPPQSQGPLLPTQPPSSIMSSSYGPSSSGSRSLPPTSSENHPPYRGSPEPSRDSYNRPPYAGDDFGRSLNQQPSSGSRGPLSGPPNKELVVYMKGLPYSCCTPKDVVNFFKPIDLAHIEIETDSKGKPTGNAFVEFENGRDMDRGMEYNLRHMGKRYIELIPLLQLEKFGPPPRSHGGGLLPPFGDAPQQPPTRTFCVSVRGLSRHVTSQDLRNYFAEVDAQTYGVHIMLTPDGMAGGEAFVEFINKEFQMRALKRDGDYMGPDRITVRTVSYEVVRKEISKPVGPPGGGRGGPPQSDHFRDHSHKHHHRDKFRDGGRGGRGGKPPQSGPPPFADRSANVLAKNISLKASDEDLCVFFSDYNISPARIKRRLIEKDSAHEAQISFHSRADAEHAIRFLDKKYFLGCRIHLELAM